MAPIFPHSLIVILTDGAVSNKPGQLRLPRSLTFLLINDYHFITGGFYESETLARSDSYLDGPAGGGFLPGG
jgi:hypothetical protein